MTTRHPMRSIESANHRLARKMALAATTAVHVALSMLLIVSPARAQGTVMPIPLAQWLDNSGSVLSAGGLCVFRAGTTTLATTYTTAALSVANANPIQFNSAGRATSGGVFLTPGESYKFVLKDFTSVTSPTCVPDTGTTIWTVDNVEAVPESSASVDVPGTAGQTITAGQVVYLSDGSGGLNAGQWYLADADLVYAGALPSVGVAVDAISSGSSGSIRLQGLMDGLSGLSAGADYYVSATAGAVTSTPPPYARLIGRAESATKLVIASNPRTTPITPRAPCGRLTLTSGTPVTTSDVTAATTVYYTPYGGCNAVPTFDGSLWSQRTFTEISIAVPSTTSQMYDVYSYDNAGTLTLELTAWTNDTTRATALTTQNGVYVKTGAATRLYLGSFRTTSVSGQTEDSLTKRFVWNYYNRVVRPISLIEGTDSWSYTTATWRQANASTANQFAVVTGVQEDAITVAVGVSSSNSSAGVGRSIGIGEGSTSAPVSSSMIGRVGGAANDLSWLTATITKIPTLGYQYYAWLEISVASGTTTWYGDNGTTTYQSGMTGFIKG